jgi:hypothetical protein
MDLSQLKSLGEIAGIGGIALGLVVLLIRPLIGALSGLPKAERAGPIKLIAVGCFVIGVLGIVAWIIGNQSGVPTVATRGAQSPGIVSGGDATVSYGSQPALSSPTTSPASPAAPNGKVRTEGDQSPGVISGGNSRIQYAPSPAR